ncbi:MAG: cbb3-type cytochrome oxidase assembly protein CcoS [Candidatus Sericytochromatia bacterium]|nr:cbb3-type cytochrome oxidase assembly protein CcoS [Candidatus Sericytochromatia bacterium]
MMIPMMLIIGGLMLYGLVWAIRSGQFDELEDEKYRMFDDAELAHIRATVPPHRP